MMSPYTAKSLKESRRNVLKDFVSVAGVLGVTHLLVLSATDKRSILRVGRLPRGPTVHFHLRSHSLAREVLSVQARPRAPSKMWRSPPLVVLNGFQKSEALRLTATVLQNAFPAINVRSSKIGSCKRVVLFDAAEEEVEDGEGAQGAGGEVEGVERGESASAAGNSPRKRIVVRVRQFSVALLPSGVSSSIKSLVMRKGVPNLEGVRDVADWVRQAGYGSESEGEEAAASRVQHQKQISRRQGSVARQSRVKLYEVGPRLDLELVKIQEGLDEGAVLFHAHRTKSSAAVQAETDERAERERLKAERRRTQEANVRRKEEDKKVRERAAEERRGAEEAKKAAKESRRKARKKEAEQDAMQGGGVSYRRGATFDGGKGRGSSGKDRMSSGKDKGSSGKDKGSSGKDRAPSGKRGRDQPKSGASAKRARK
ncbi:Brix domain-containing protein [Helicosporidium sp. ATCC 50920]|nr:Brix domain-containing protein [Helicosporidium sp. ATCC 50920]|eukprot:KDD76251.1 Brix domain-containing protein [Helicosporidium sp. ATCC 50920]